MAYKKYYEENYDYYVEKYKKISNENSHALSKRELKEYDLPDNKWFVKHCPNDNVMSWLDFIQWCDLIPKTVGKGDIKNKEKYSNILLDYEKTLGRPLKASDININTVGFAYDVIKKMWGGLINCKKEIGLKPCVSQPCHSIDYYDNKMQIALRNIYSKTHTYNICWDDFIRYKGIGFDTKTVKKICQLKNINVCDYFKEYGFTLVQKKGMGKSVILSDDEVCLSMLEQKFSIFLRENNIPYKRDVKYINIDNSITKKKCSCDYVIDYKYWIEICGMLTTTSNNWKNIECRDKIKEDYRKRLLFKENILIKNSIPYLFLFKEDFNNNAYINKTLDFITP